jgi:hypothetical protein
VPKPMSGMDTSSVSRTVSWLVRVVMASFLSLFLLFVSFPGRRVRMAALTGLR